MKRTLTLMACLGALLWAGTVQAQAVLAKHADTKKVKPEFLAEARYLGEYQGLFCWVGDKKKDEKQVLLMDQNLVVLRAMTVETDEASEILAASLQGNRASLLLQERTRKCTKVYSAVVDLDSMRYVNAGLELRDSLAYGRKDAHHMWAAVSPNGSKVAQISVLEMTETKQYTATIRMMDALLNTLWEREYALSTMSELCVTDDGMIVTMGMEEQEDGETAFFFNVLDANESTTYAGRVKSDPIREMRLAGVVNGYALALGTFRPEGSDPDDDLCGGTVALSFNTRNGQLTGFSLRPFMNEDINILYNKKTKKVQKNLTAELVAVNTVTTNGYGAVVALGRNFTQTVTEMNGTLTNNYCSMGLHLVAVDTTGHIRWARNIRRNDTQTSADGLLEVSLLSRGDDTYVFKSESPKLPATYDIAKDAKEFEAGSKNNIVFYCIGAEGEVSKTVVEAKTKQNLFRTENRPDGTFMYFSQNGSRTRMAELKIGSWE